MTLALPVDEIGLDAEFPGFRENVHIHPATPPRRKFFEMFELDSVGLTEKDQLGSNGTKPRSGTC